MVEFAKMRIGIFVCPQAVPSSVANLVAAFQSANQVIGQPQFETLLVSEQPGPFGRDGVFLAPQADLNALSLMDLLVVPALEGTLEQALGDCAGFLRLLPGWLSEPVEPPGARGVAAACTGTFLLAAAGVLEGKQATTHWMFAAEFRSAFPNVDLRFDGLVQADGDTVTSGGGSGAIDLALALIERDAGADVARTVASHMMFDHRRGPQSNFFPLTPPRASADELVSRAQDLIARSLNEGLSVNLLANRLNVTSRTLLRRFQTTLGITVQDYIQRARMERARSALEDGQGTIESIVQGVGYTDRASFGRSFKRHFGVGPGAFRSRARPSVVGD